MSTPVRLISFDELARWIGNSGVLKPGEVGICPVSDLLYVAELAKKGRRGLARHSFLIGLRQLLNGPIERGELVVAGLDVTRLCDALFERYDHSVAGLWSEAANTTVTPRTSLRRLALRPSACTWWPEEIYTAAEELCTSLEEAEDSV